MVKSNCELFFNKKKQHVCNPYLFKSSSSSDNVSSDSMVKELLRDDALVQSSDQEIEVSVLQSDAVYRNFPIVTFEKFEIS